MTEPASIQSQEPALDVPESGHDETLPNDERGCDYLQHNAAYVRSDVQALSTPGGEIPRFVELDSPVEYRETSERGAIFPGYRHFPGVKFALAYHNEGYTTTPLDAIPDYQERIEGLRFDGDHYGEITAARSFDLLMSVGKTHWRTPEEYVEECRELGLNLKIPSGPSSEPPVIDPFVTRCWVVHPDGVEEGRAGIIGYAVLTRAIYTTGERATADDPDVPTYAEEWAETGKVSLATPGEEIPADESPDASIGDYLDDEGIESAPPGYQDRHEDLEAAWKDWFTDYNRARSVASALNTDMGANPSKETLIEALAETGIHPDAITGVGVTDDD